jgi:hypothetical protein
VQLLDHLPGTVALLSDIAGRGDENADGFHDQASFSLMQFID